MLCCHVKGIPNKTFYYRLPDHRFSEKIAEKEQIFMKNGIRKWLLNQTTETISFHIKQIVPLYNLHSDYAESPCTTHVLLSEKKPCCVKLILYETRECTVLLKIAVNIDLILEKSPLKMFQSPPPQQHCNLIIG